MARFRAEIILGLLLVAVTWAAYWPLRFCDFVNYDDPDYVTENRQVKSGLTPANMRWAFTTMHASNWHPLTWLSLQLDATLFGVSAPAFHRTNLILHCAASFLLFLGLRWMTGAKWRSALVGGLFALHPLHVESVAWIAERKDVLSGLFWMLTILAYAWYVRRPSVLRYLVVLLSFVLGLLAKPMLVTLPFVLLLLDYWPLQRFAWAAPKSKDDSESTSPPPIVREERSLILAGAAVESAVANGPRTYDESPFDRRRQPTAPRAAESLVPVAVAAKPGVSLSRLLAEKVPFIVLSVISCLVTIYAQKRAVSSLEKVPLDQRFLNAVTAYGGYLAKMCWPTDLCVLYPHPGTGLPLWQPVVAGIVLLLLTGLAVWQWRRHPYLIVGWLWFVGTLVPVIGLVQVGEQAMADRYTYIPLIGMFIALAWGLPALLAARGIGPQLVVFPAILLLLACPIGVWRQLANWRSSVALWKHAIDVTENNANAHNNLGVVFLGNDDLETALEHFDAALQIRPGHKNARNNRGLVFLYRGDLERGAASFAEVLAAAPDMGAALTNLGLVRSWQGKADESIALFERAVRSTPRDPRCHFHLAHVVWQRDRERAKAEYGEGLRLEPDMIEHSRRLAWRLATNANTQRTRGNFALTLALEACEATESAAQAERADLLDTLAAAYAATGHFANAESAAHHAEELALVNGKSELAEAIEKRRQQYARREPFCESR